MLHLTSVADLCDHLNGLVGRVVSWASLGMVLLMVINVVMRYLFAAGDPWQHELVRFMHASLFLLGAGYALREESHVRVDVLYHHFSEVRKAWVNLMGTLLFLLPMAYALIYFSYDYVVSSWTIYEGSSEYLGMPGVFLLKTCIWGCGVLLGLQGLSIILRSWLTIREGTAHG